MAIKYDPFKDEFIQSTASSSAPPTGQAGGDLSGTYPNPSVNDGADSTAIHDNINNEINLIAEKTTPAPGDWLLIEDSASSLAKKKLQIGNLPGGSGTDPDAIHDNVAGEIATIASKTPAVSADLLLIEDSADSNNKKSITVGALRVTESQITDLDHKDPEAIHDNVASEISAITEKTAPVSEDLFLMEDSEDSNNKKRIKYSNLVPGFTGAPVAGQIFKSADTTFSSLPAAPSATSGNKLINYDVNDIDKGGIVDLVNNGFTVPAGEEGVYGVSMGVAWEGTAGQSPKRIEGFIVVNSSIVKGATFRNIGSNSTNPTTPNEGYAGSNIGVMGSDTQFVELSAGDLVQFELFFERTAHIVRGGTAAVTITRAMIFKLTSQASLDPEVFFGSPNYVWNFPCKTTSQINASVTPEHFRDGIDTTIEVVTAGSEGLNQFSPDTQLLKIVSGVAGAGDPAYQDATVSERPHLFTASEIGLPVSLFGRVLPPSSGTFTLRIIDDKADGSSLLAEATTTTNSASNPPTSTDTPEVLIGDSTLNPLDNDILKITLEFENSDNSRTVYVELVSWNFGSRTLPYQETRVKQESIQGAGFLYDANPPNSPDPYYQSHSIASLVKPGTFRIEGYGSLRQSGGAPGASAMVTGKYLPEDTSPITSQTWSDLNSGFRNSGATNVRTAGRFDSTVSESLEIISRVGQAVDVNALRLGIKTIYFFEG